MLHQRRPEHFGQLARPMPSQGIHLPQSVAGRDVTLGKQQVLEAVGGNGGHPLRIARDRHRCTQSGYTDLAVERRQGSSGGVAQHQNPAQQGEANDSQRAENQPHAATQPTGPIFGSPGRQGSFMPVCFGL